MFKKLIGLAFILLMVSTDVRNQLDYYQYSAYDEEYPTLEEGLWAPRGRMALEDQLDYEEPEYYDDYRYYNAPMQRSIGEEGIATGKRAEEVGIINSVLGIVGSGKCLIKCVLSLAKICTKVAECIWNCFTPEKTVSLLRNNDDSDLRIEVRYSTSSDISPNDIVQIADCIRKCLTRYLPKSLNSLFDWFTCITKQCICWG